MPCVPYSAMSCPAMPCHNLNKSALRTYEATLKNLILFRNRELVIFNILYMINIFACDLGSQLIVGAIHHQGRLMKIRIFRPSFHRLFKFNDRILV